MAPIFLVTPTLEDVYRRLHAHYGHQHWWPAQSPFEVLVGTILTQNTNWKNVARAIENLREAGVLAPRRLMDLPLEELETLIRPAGYFRLKAGRLRNLLRVLLDEYGGSLEAMFATDLETLRPKLLAINGVGPETADSILLYAGNLPSFVVDTYTYRVMTRHGWIEFDADYHAIKDYFESSLERDPQLYNEFHALLVRVGNEYCGKTPRCEACPLRELLPEDGPLVSPEF
jgi:endonuclease III related protein